MTTVYFVRHAEPNYDNHDDLTRELTPKGLADRRLVTAFLADKQVDAVLSSPFHRAVDTVKHFADCRGLPITLVEDFRERRIDSVWIDDFNAFARRQWADYSYKLTDGESLQEVQDRYAAALTRTVREHAGQTLVVGSHGTALSTLVHRFVPTFGYAGFCRVKGLTPWIVRFVFDETGGCVAIEQYDLFAGSRETLLGDGVK